MPTPRDSQPRPARKRRNLLADAGVTDVDYKDVELLRRFISEKGKIRPRRATGLTPQQQRAVASAIKIAREMALLPYGRR